MISVKVEDVIKAAKKRGLTIVSNGDKHIINISKGNNLVVEFILWSSYPKIGPKTSLIYGFIVKDAKTNSVIYKENVDEYDGNINKVDEMLKSYMKIIGILSVHDIRITDKYLFSLFGFKFMRKKVLEYFADNQWKEFNC